MFKKSSVKLYLKNITSNGLNYQENYKIGKVLYSEKGLKFKTKSNEHTFGHPLIIYIVL